MLLQWAEDSELSCIENLKNRAVDFSGTEKGHVIDFHKTSCDGCIEKISSEAILLSESK